MTGIYASHGIAAVRSFSPSHAWDAKVVEHAALPPRVVAVNKKEQVITLLEFQSSLESTTTYLCSTGQAPGDKVVEGDLKTPEGIYFVVQHLKSGLDFDMYGYEAYTLNYPNPVDKIRRKTGYGIWVHGKGNGIAPLQTQGCIALNNNDLNTLGNKLTPGLPVIISHSVDLHTSSGSSVETIKMLQGLSQQWAKAWENRSAAMFDFYNQEAYSIANEPFSAFKSNKERLFKRLPWIKNEIRDIQVLEGPGYWVTWFYQDYQAPNLTSKGVRRLYWSQNTSGDFKIIGMEWLPGMNTSAQLVREDPPVPPIDKAPKTETVPQKFDTIIAETASNDVSTDISSGAPSSTAVTKPVSPSVQPQKTASSQTDTPTPKATQPKKQIPLLVESTTGGVIGATHSQTPLPMKKQPKPTPPLLADTSAGGTSAPVAGTTTGKTASSLVAENSGKSAVPPAQSSATRAEGKKPSEPLREEPTTVTQGKPQKGQQTATQDSTPEKLSADTLLLSDKDALALIERWRRAWESGNLKQYAAFYAKDAVQDRRTSRTAIENHKTGLWKRAHPKTVALSKIQITRQGSTIIATMQQHYTSRNGTGDKGKKTLYLKNIGGSWHITKEIWSSN